MSDSARPYFPAIPSRTRTLVVRGLDVLVREWGPANGRPVLLLHGFRDTSLTFQFLVDALSARTPGLRFIAPDWRGHGGSGWAPQGYWYHDYLADLDAVADAVMPDAPLDIIAHSLGGNLACVYAGARPQRVASVVSIDGFALKDAPAGGAPDQIAKWLDSWKRAPKDRPYASVDDMAQRLREANPRLSADKALFLAQGLARPVDGGFAFAFDPGHRRPFPTLHRIDEWAACWQRAEARVLWIAAGNRFERMPRAGEGNFDWRIAQFKRGSWTQIPDTGHNIHHDAPEQLADVLAGWLEGDATTGASAR